jgi:ferredoxin/flavodoxin---NADP+ reductase
MNGAVPRPAECRPARFRVAIVGGGPSGFYAAESLLRAGQSIDVDMFEQLPVPHGLVRFGVAPDHPKLKQVTLIFDRIAKMPGFRFFGGIEIGGAVSLPALRASYHAVVLATGASIARLMDIPGETLPGSHRAADFVAWYNGHPDFRDCHFDLSGERAVIVGHGNVALDVARILAKTADELRHTDIAAHALDALAESRIRDIHIVGRRGAGGTKFAAKELMEFEELGECDPMIEAADATEIFPADASNADGETAATLTILKRFAERPSTGRRRCIFRFNLDPVAIGGDGRVERMLFRQKLNGSRSDDARGGARLATIDCDLVLSSIGRRCAPLAGVPYDRDKGVHANVEGRITADGVAWRGLYACGWSKRGPFGTIGTNRACSVQTISQVLADLPRLDDPPNHPDALLAGMARQIQRYIDYAGWQRIDAQEVARGNSAGKPREKFVVLDEMIAAAGRGVGW